MIKVVVILVLIVGIITGVFLLTSGNLKLFSRASEDVKTQYPLDILITNVTDSSFTISYFTPEQPVYTKVYYGEDSSKLDKYAEDDVDRYGGVARHTHHVTLKNLKSEKEYYVLVDTGEDESLKNKYIKQKTASKLSSSNFPNIKYFIGTVYGNLGFGNTDTIVYFKTDKGQFLSTRTEPNGRWGFDMEKYRRSNLKEYYNVLQVDQAELLAVAGVEGVSYLKTYPSLSKEYKLQLEQPRFPIYGLQLGPLSTDSDQDAAKANVQNSTPKQRNFFETVWAYITSFFGFKIFE